MTQIFVRCPQKLKRIDIRKTYAIEATGKTTRITLENNETIDCLEPIKHFEEILPTNTVLRVSKDILVIIDKIEEVYTESGKIVLENGKTYQSTLQKVRRLNQQLVTKSTKPYTTVVS